MKCSFGSTTNVPEFAIDPPGAFTTVPLSVNVAPDSTVTGPELVNTDETVNDPAATIDPELITVPPDKFAALPLPNASIVPALVSVLALPTLRFEP